MHTATLLNNGKVLITGGFTGAGPVLATAEIYDPIASTFSPTGSLAQSRYLHTATLLSNGKVLIVGGANIGAYATAELYTPACANLSMDISIAPTSFTLNPFSSVSISGTVTNHTSQDQHLVFLQSWITQGTITIAAGGALVVGPGELGLVKASSTQALGSFHSANDGFAYGAGMTLGPATLTVELRQSVGGTDVVWDSRAFPITLTP
jgi:hypothetical protein